MQHTLEADISSDAPPELSRHSKPQNSGEISPAGQDATLIR